MAWGDNRTYVSNFKLLAAARAACLIVRSDSLRQRTTDPPAADYHIRQIYPREYPCEPVARHPSARSVRVKM